MMVAGRYWTIWALAVACGGETPPLDGTGTESAATSSAATSTDATSGSATTTSTGVIPTSTSVDTTTAITDTTAADSNGASTDADETSTGGSTGTDGSTVTTAPGTETGTTSSCIPAEETCNGLDDDCDDVVDNVDVAGDGFCDCLRIALIGNKGANPSAQFENWLEMQGTQVERIHTTNVPLDAKTLAQYDIVLLDWLIRTYTAEEAEVLRTWIEAGGGIVSLSGFTTNNNVGDRPNTLIAPLGLGYSADKGFFDGPITQFADHPITAGLSELVFGGGLYVKILPNNPGTAEVIMTLPQGPVGVVQQQGAGRMFVFGDEWIEFDSEWAQFPEIEAFWANTLRWLAPQNYCYKPQ